MFCFKLPGFEQSGIKMLYEKTGHQLNAPDSSPAQADSLATETNELVLAHDRDTAIAAIETLKAEVLRSIDRVIEIKTSGHSLADLNDERGIDFYEEVRKFEIEMIRQALVKADGNQRAAAQLLGLKHTTLNNKVKHYKIQVHLIAAQRKVRELRRILSRD